MLKQIFLFAILLLSLTACRVRLIDVLIEPEYEPAIIEEPLPTEPEPDNLPENIPDEVPDENIEEELPEETDELPCPMEEIIEPEIEPTVYIAPEIETPIEDNPAPILVPEPPEPEYIPQSITIEETTDYSPGETTLDDDGDGTLGIIIDQYTGILNRGLGSLFECQRVYVYLERLDDFHTVNRNSFEHNLIIESGGHNAAARRGNDALLVDADWVVRQNPEIIIRIVSTDVLGPGVTSTAQAAAVRSNLLYRPGLEGVSAVINRRILLLSDALLQSEEGRLIAKLYIAHTMYPTLFSDVNIADVAHQIKESGGMDYTIGVLVH